MKDLQKIFGVPLIRDASHFIPSKKDQPTSQEILKSDHLIGSFILLRNMEPTKKKITYASIVYTQLPADNSTLFWHNIRHGVRRRN